MCPLACVGRRVCVAPPFCCLHQVITFGQYLRPSKKHLPIHEYVTPEAFEAWRVEGERMGFLYVASGPLVRSSYKAGGALRTVVCARARVHVGVRVCVCFGVCGCGWAPVGCALCLDGVVTLVAPREIFWGGGGGGEVGGDSKPVLVAARAMRTRGFGRVQQSNRIAGVLSVPSPHPHPARTTHAEFFLKGVLNKRKATVEAVAQ